MSAVDLTDNLAPGRTPQAITVPNGMTWLSPSGAIRIEVEALGGNIAVNDGPGNSYTLAPGEGPREFVAPTGLGFPQGAIIVDTSAGAATARIGTTARAA